ncbi:penicillin-binding protein activator [Aliamphritea spongicola]|uniref:penicillin-binding protein activator n=1 Tax=Aliamphritea spongicola TaxID=707589 RepID=UPI00196A4BE8|nr:penicillin-binding protein activator [Aliamphritea spongicola]MBN3563431.1 penicillin-binding protein activator [Aliamphritea spongicola]
MTFAIRLSLIVTTSATLLLGGCGTSPITTGTPQVVESTEQQVSKLLLQADQAAPIEQARLKAEAARILIAANRRDEAVNLIDGIDLRLLSPTLKFDIASLRAQAALDQQDGATALRYLEQLPTDDPRLQPDQKYQVGQMAAEAYGLENNQLRQAQQLIRLGRFGLEEDKEALHDSIWAALMALDLQTLQQIALATDNSYTEQGWYELALAVRSATDLATQTNNLQQWQTLWQSHPANTAAPDNLTALANNQLIVSDHIALVLPLSGKLQKPAEAIMTGFMAAHYQAAQQGKKTSQITILDSSQITSPEALYQVAAEKGVDLIIGPLEKQLVSDLVTLGNAPIPTLTLNVVADSAAANIYQFGLAIEDEAIQAARRAWNDGQRTALVMTLESEWGKRATAAFTEEFSALGGLVLDTIEYANRDDYSAKVTDLLAINESEERSNLLRQIIGPGFETEDRRRQDVDAIFLGALPQAARQIKPTLAFFYAGNIPVYATSNIYSGRPNPISDQDLNNILFTGSPWLLRPPSDNHIRLAQQGKNTDSRFGRLYALGLDAYQLYPYLNQLAASPSARINGETGSLSIQHNNHVQRELDWAVFQDGQPQLIP